MKYYLALEFESVEGPKSYGTVSSFNKSSNLVKFTDKRKSFSSVELASTFGKKIVNAIQSKGYINIVDEIMGMSFTVRSDSLSIKVVSYH